MQGTGHARQWIGLSVVVAIGLAATLYLGLRAPPPWPSTFCQPVSRVVGVDATRILEYKFSSSSGMGFLLDSQGLHHDIGTAFTHAPTSQLRSELAIYRRATGNDASLLQLTTAISTFDSQVRTQLQRCDIRPLGK
jgi:hypothetical protein